MIIPYDPLASVQAAGPPGTISFVYGLPDPATFPVDDLRQAADHVLQERAGLALQYGPEQGYGPLLDAVRARLAAHENLPIDRRRIMLTSGSSQALDHFCTVFTRAGDLVLVEAPTYHETLQLFRDHGLRLSQIPMDQDGLNTEALAEKLDDLERRGDRAHMLYTIPNHQNPSGISLAGARRETVLEVARAHGLLVIEDDVYRELTYEGQVPHSLYALETAQAQPQRGRVVRIGSFSKIMAPGLRLGWLMAAPGLIERLVGSGLRCMGGGANPLVANILTECVANGRLERHIASLHAVYRERRDVMLEALEHHMPAGVHWTRPGGGFFVWLTLPEWLTAREAVERAREAGVWVLAGDPFFAETPTGAHLRLAFSYVTPDKIYEGIEILAGVLAHEQ